MKMTELDQTKLVKTLKDFRKEKPWRGSLEERVAKWTSFVSKLGEMAGLTIRFVYYPNPQEDPEGIIRTRVSTADLQYAGLRIVLIGKVSVITALMQFACMLEDDQGTGPNDEEALDWAYGLFKEVWPSLAAKLVKQPCGQGGQFMYVKKSTLEDNKFITPTAGSC